MKNEAPRRFWRITFKDRDGRERRRYIKCPYLTPKEDGHRRPLVVGDIDFTDTYFGMAAALATLEWYGAVTSYRITPVPSERISVIRDHAVRWSDVRSELEAAA